MADPAAEPCREAGEIPAGETEGSAAVVGLAADAGTAAGANAANAAAKAS